MVKGACFDLSEEVSLRDVHVNFEPAVNFTVDYPACSFFNLTRIFHKNGAISLMAFVGAGLPANSPERTG